MQLRNYGFIMGGNGSLLAAHLVYIIVIFAWVMGIMTPFFMILKRVGLFRVSPEVEAAGLDVSHHGGSACELNLSTCTHAIRRLRSLVKE